MSGSSLVDVEGGCVKRVSLEGVGEGPNRMLF